MPVQEFALDAAGNSVQVFFSDESENVTVLLNRSIIGVIPSREGLRTARAFALPDGSTLRVQLVETQLQVFRDGQLLSQNPYGVPPQGPYSQPQASYGYAATPQGPYGAFADQQPGYGYGTPPVQAAPLPLGEAIRQLPRQYIKVVLTERSAATFAEEQGKASWGSVWVQLIYYALVVAVLEYLANVISQTGSSDLALIVAIFIVVIPIGFFIIGGIYYLIARAFGGQGTFLAHIYAMLLYSVPLGTLAALLSLIPSLGRLAAGIVDIYSIVLSVRMIVGVHRLSGGKARAVILTPVAVIVLIVVLAYLVRG